MNHWTPTTTQPAATDAGAFDQDALTDTLPPLTTRQAFPLHLILRDVLRGMGVRRTDWTGNREAFGKVKEQWMGEPWRKAERSFGAMQWVMFVIAAICFLAAWYLP